MLYNPPKMKSENRKQPVNHPPPSKKNREGYGMRYNTTIIDPEIIVR